MRLDQQQQGAVHVGKERDQVYQHGIRPLYAHSKLSYTGKRKILLEKELLKKLNKLAATHPFCILYKSKRNDPL